LRKTFENFMYDVTCIRHFIYRLHRIFTYLVLKRFSVLGVTTTGHRKAIADRDSNKNS